MSWRVQHNEYDVETTFWSQKDKADRMRSIGSSNAGYICATNARVLPLLIYFPIIALFTANDALTARKNCMMRRAAEALSQIKILKLLMK